MKVAIEARALQQPASGVRRYLEQLVTTLQRRSHDEWHVIDQAPSNPLAVWWWQRHDLPCLLNESGAEVVHLTKAMVPTGLRAPAVVTIYDVIPLLYPASQRPLARVLWPQVLRQAARRAQHILTISEASKRDISQHLAVDPERITVTPLAVDPTMWQRSSSDEITQLAKRYELSRPYLLHVGTIEPRKNVPLLVRAFARIARDVDVDLVLIGRSYKGSEQVDRELAKAQLTDRVHRVGVVPDAELPTWYSGAVAGVWPSLYEGWGFPAQEALSCGTPVVVSDGGSLPEVVGDVGTVVPFSSSTIVGRATDGVFEERLAAALRSVVNRSASEADRSAARAHATAHTWHDVADRTYGVYEKMIS